MIEQLAREAREELNAMDRPERLDDAVRRQEVVERLVRIEEVAAEVRRALEPEPQP